MKYTSVLKQYGYKPYMITRTVSVYNKENITNRATAVIYKKRDRANKIVLKVTQKVKDNGENMATFHKEYLEMEAEVIKKKFAESRL